MVSTERKQKKAHNDNHEETPAYAAGVATLRKTNAHQRNTRAAPPAGANANF
eukprot:SAG11_NODE_1714_length_4398_cov_2.677832_2_plen_52_part_00